MLAQAAGNRMSHLELAFVEKWATLNQRLQAQSLEDIDLWEYLEVVGDEARFNFESANILREFYQDCKNVVELAPLPLATPFQKVFLTAGSPATQIAELPFRDQLPLGSPPKSIRLSELNQEKRLNLEYWDAISAVLSPETIKRLHELAKEIDLDLYEPYFSPRNDIADPKDWDEFDFFKINCQKWLECLQQAAEKECGVMMLLIY